MRHAFSTLAPLAFALATGCGIAGEELFSGSADPSGDTSGSGGSGQGGAASTSTSTTSTNTTTATTTATTTTTTGAGGASSTTATTTTTTTTTTSTTTTSGQGGGDPVVVGCSDGTREYLIDLAAEPTIAGCAGGFDVPSVTSAASMAPTCNRVSGNDSANPTGTGCSIEDMCATGWHVCNDAGDFAASSTSGQCEPFAGGAQEFYLTRQVQDAQGNCTAPPDTNNITGCGTLGAAPVGANCAPLDRRMRQQDCGPTQNWYCGTNNNDGLIEATIVVKVGSGEGGVLCCKG